MYEMNLQKRREYENVLSVWGVFWHFCCTFILAHQCY